jgi:guanylate kinase
VKEKIAKQLQKNKDLFAEVVVEIAEKGTKNYSEMVLDVMKPPLWDCLVVKKVTRKVF